MIVAPMSTLHLSGADWAMVGGVWLFIALVAWVVWDKAQIINRTFADLDAEKEADAAREDAA